MTRKSNDLNQESKFDPIGLAVKGINKGKHLYLACLIERAMY